MRMLELGLRKYEAGRNGGIGGGFASPIRWNERETWHNQIMLHDLCLRMHAVKDGSKRIWIAPLFLSLKKHFQA